MISVVSHASQGLQSQTGAHHGPWPVHRLNLALPQERYDGLEATAPSVLLPIAREYQDRQSFLLKR